MFLKVKVMPGARRNSVEGWQEDVLKVKIKAVPEKGKANEALVAFLAETLGVSKGQIRVVSGQTSRLKKVKIKDVDQISFK